MPGVLISDFDGTMTRRDFYRLILQEHLPPGTTDFWREYLAGRISHFEALRLTFASAPIGEKALLEVARRMELDPALPQAIARLRARGWSVVVASAGCAWYIRLLLNEVIDMVTIHANEGDVESNHLAMRLPIDSIYFSRETGIDKAAIVRETIRQGGTVAFAGDGLPDLPPALLVPPQWRFARADLAEQLGRRGESFTPFTRWSEIADILLERDSTSA